MYGCEFNFGSWENCGKIVRGLRFVGRCCRELFLSGYGREDTFMLGK